VRGFHRKVKAEIEVEGAGLPALAFDKLSGRKRRQYFAAVQAGLDRDYDPMAKLFTAVIEKTFQIHEKT
jgi:cell filamentation protein